MNVDVNQIAVAIRPRNHWEAIDLGFRLARQHWRGLYGVSLAFYLPVVGIIFLLFGAESMWSLVVLRWLKPLFDRVPLIVLSRAVFSSAPGIKEALRALPAAMRNGLFSSLVWRRFDPSRSFTLPVWQLEGLRGKQFAQRLRTVKKRTTAANWLTFVCVALEAIAMLAFFMTLIFMVPEQLGVDWLDVEQDWFWILFNILHALAMALVGPLYVAGGFTLYLNRRTILEGWDIEIAFRRMAPRISAVTPVEAA